MNYWKECIETAFSEADISATKEQIKYVAELVEGAHEVYSESTKETCSSCGGEGKVIFSSYGMCSVSECTRCRGSGKVSPGF